MADKEQIKVKRITDISDKATQTKVMSKLLAHISSCQDKFNSAYLSRRNTLLELNAIYRNQSYLDKNRVEWQTKSFIPLTFDAVERKTSILHQALWGNRVATPFSILGRTAEDHAFANSAETLLNNTMDRIGFYGSSEECLRSTCKYGLGVYRYGWLIRTEKQLVRQTKRDEKGKVIRQDDLNPIYEYSSKDRRTSQPFIRSVDIVDHIGWDATCKSFDKWQCDYVYEIKDETPEQILDSENSGDYDDGSFNKLSLSDPHGIQAMSDQFAGDKKVPQMRRDDGLNEPFATPIKPTYPVVDWFGWFDIDGDNKREFIRVICIPEKKLILAAYENIMNEYPFIDIQFSKSLHSMTPWGVIDPVIKMQYEINELHNQRGDGIKLKLNPQFLININRATEDHSYVSTPGALHPLAMEDGEDVGSALKVLEFQNLESISVTEEENLTNKFAQLTGVADLNKVLGSSNKDTPATTVVSILNEQQAGNSMIVNGVLERHGQLGQRIFKQLQLFGEEKFILRDSGRAGIIFRNESMENILGDYDIKVTTSSFFGNRQIELQYLIQLKPLWAQAPHIDQIELDRAILENILPKRVDNILNVPAEPLPPVDEQLLFVIGKGTGVKINPQESLIDLNSKLRAHSIFMKSEWYKKNMPGDAKFLFEEYIQKITEQIQNLQTQQQMQQVMAAKAAGNMMPDQTSSPMNPQGNIGNTGSPAVRTIGNAVAPKPNNMPQQPQSGLNI